MRLYSPEGTTVPLSVVAAIRPPSLSGLRIGLLDNTKAPVDRIMEHLGNRLRERYDNVTLVTVAKRHPSLPAEREVIERLATEADVVINGLGD